MALDTFVEENSRLDPPHPPTQALPVRWRLSMTAPQVLREQSAYIHTLTIRETTLTSSKLKREIPDTSVQSRTFISEIDINIPEMTRLHKHKQ